MKTKCKFIVAIVSFIAIFPAMMQAQSYNTERTALVRFLTRMYNSAPFEGVKAVNDYDNNYLISVVVLDPAKYGNNESTMNRVAGVKAMSQASRFFSGSKITADLVIKTTEDAEGESFNEMIETINENSIGFVKALEELTNFDNESNKKVFIYITEIKKNKE